MSLILEVDSNFPQPEVVEHAIEVLNETAGIFVYPTDTIYGLGCKVNNKEGIATIYSIKKRDEQKAFSIMFNSLAQVKKYAKVSAIQEKILRKYLPGPFTFILPATKLLPKVLLGPNNTVGIRIPGNKLCLALIKEAKTPIVTTSLNISGRKVLTNLEMISPALLKNIDLILDAGKLGEKASTVVNLTKKKPIILRQGLGKFLNTQPLTT